MALRDCKKAACEFEAGLQATTRVVAVSRGDYEHGALAMSAIPLHLQRKFERRWEARFASRVASAVQNGNDSKGIVNSLPRCAKAKERATELSKPACGLRA